MERNDFIPRLAIVEENVLAATALRTLLEPLAIGVDVCIYESFERFAAVSHRTTVHYFISSKVFFEHRDFFLPIVQRVIVMMCGTSPYFSDSSVRVLNVSQPEHELVKDLLRIYREGHHRSVAHCGGVEHQEILTPREKEVLRMAVMGFVNKEIADKYSISLTTVISHRRNIVEKLGFKSLSALTVYAVTNGIVKIEEI
ncbi:MAG: LuxR family transcriptional regulator [Tidjanibacter sp.]|nr:LuxR family transcriptional regulator [Tidjanibacter sp.]